MTLINPMDTTSMQMQKEALIQEICNLAIGTFNTELNKLDSFYPCMDVTIPLKELDHLKQSFTTVIVDHVYDQTLKILSDAFTLSGWVFKDGTFIGVGDETRISLRLVVTLKN